MVIDRVPDILHMGHVHKNGLDNYHGVDIVNSGTWQSTTDLQIGGAHRDALLHARATRPSKHTFKILDFNTW